MQRTGDLLVIGIGNTLRSDDAAGIRAAGLVAERFPAVTVVATQELHPELAETIARHDTVLFLDASIRVDKLTVTSVAASRGTNVERSHNGSLEALLALSASLYGRLPAQALLVEIPAESLALGETLTPLTMQMVHECVGIVGRYVHAEQE